MRCLWVIAVLLALPSAAQASVLHADPAGSGDCSAVSPCAIADAFAAAGSGDEIELAAGRYDAPSSLPSGAIGLLVHGPDSGTAPLVAFSGNARLALFGAGSRVAHLRVTATPAVGQPAVQAPQLDHVVARSDSAGDGCSATASVIETACSSAVGAGFALRSLNGGPSALSLHGATFVGGTYGFEVRTSALIPTTVAISARNTIFRGTTGDVRLDPSRLSGGTDVSLTLTADHSRYAVTNSAEDPGSAAGPGGAELVDAGGNVTGDPAFRDAATGDLRLTDASAVVDAGSPAEPLPATDVRGYPRTIAAAPDVGAYEFVPVPPAPTLTSPALGTVLYGAIPVRWSLPMTPQPGSAALRLARRGGAATTLALAGDDTAAHEATIARTGFADGTYDLELTYREPIEGRTSAKATAAGVVLAPPPPDPSLGSADLSASPPPAAGPTPLTSGGSVRITALRVAPRAFTAERPGTVRFSLSAPARITLVTERQAGRGWVRVGTLRRSLAAGRVTLRVRRGLRRAPHRVRVVAADVAGHRSPQLVAAFRVR